MTEDFSAEEKALMIEHMNDDHVDACLLYATHHLGLGWARSATMTGITRSDMTLDVEMSDGSTQAVTYTFERELTSVEDAARHLAELVSGLTGE